MTTRPKNITPEYLGNISINGYNVYIRKTTTTFFGIPIKTRKFLKLGCQEFSKEELKVACRLEDLNIINLRIKDLERPNYMPHASEILDQILRELK